ncbi:non-ribosomal peptide synthetase [Pseudomonas rubra]|uniref:Amino acid adenylation domain-containing protein n=1 Tax=Pseudomonas rubra TaxID=2942627 RepID=A0ABT5P7A3_9PSED|nr:non-ribosomal peptide synthetase [Pseudomonas rubra]MDD1013909.1 amino acid adenylation domain-containing protein [Pseudomonas rubra]MDD1038270.1 amino acid adenylation domain-containing protein [Pseudomonas rubra]MDD1154640.1 amino acid adenylation domain-containing protein [Pseudomonas rubra]
MSINELLQTLSANNVQLALKDGQLAVQGNRQVLTDAALVAQLREHKADLVAMIARGEYVALKQGAVQVPDNLIPPGCTRITPAMLNLASVDQDSLDGIVACIPGGAANVQDIYPLAPLQQGLLFHHVSATEHDPYVLRLRFMFADEGRLQAFAAALRGVIARHDILRTSVHWKGLQSPLQVVWRHAELQLLDLPIDDPRRDGFDLTQAPLIRLLREAPQADGKLVATLQFHHIALDHSALEVVQHELVALLSGEAERLGAPVPFRNYVAQAVLGINEAEHERFFRDMLGEVDEPTLAYAIQDMQGDGLVHNEHSVDLPDALCQGLRALARSHGVSVASLFHLAWGRVLGGLTGRDRVVFGTVLMGRLQGAEAIDRALGIFINTLPLRVDLDDVDLAAAIKASHQRLSALMRHEHASLALAQRCSGVRAGVPLFNALLNYRHSAVAAEQPRRAALAGIEVVQAVEATTYPLTLSVDDLGQGLRLTLLASAQVPAQRVCGYLLQTLESLLQMPQVAANALEMLPHSERHELLETFNDYPAVHNGMLPLHRRIEEHARRYPDDTAATQAGQALGYGELNARANALAHHLIGLGVQPEDRVAVLARRGLETLVGLLAVLKAGACYVPVDAAHPDERIRYLLEDSAPRAVLTQHALRARLDAVEVPLLVLDRPHWPARNDDLQVPGLGANTLAYVIYTSGSTGQPKGVMVEQQTLGNLVDWHCRAFDLCRGRQTSSLAGFGFDAMAWEIWPALCAGATVHLAPVAEGNEDLDAMLQWWCAQPLDVSFLPTPVAEYAFSQQTEHPTLRTLLVGGDRLRQFSRNQRFAVVNNYGPTETTVVASSGAVEAGAVLHIGRPMDNARLYVLDAQLQPVALGVPGELYIGGAGVARGYLGRPQLTAERFLADPFCVVPGQRMYRSGDLVRWLADGTLEYLGRNDDQVKIRGVRIELGEIESRLGSLAGINEAVVVAREDQPGQPRLVAYFTAQADVEPLDPQGLRAQLQAHLPEYMVPVAFVELAALPLTANGKLDRRALPRPERSALIEQGYQAPEGELEHSLAQLWAELLEVERVGRHDRFFSLGGHSLLAMRMVSQVRLRLGVELPLTDLFANDELAAVATALGNAGRSELPPILATPRTTHLPMAFAQQRLWFLAQMEGGNQAYNVPLALGLRGPLDAGALECALLRIVERHETLRSGFVPHEDSAEVVIAASVRAGWFRREEVTAQTLAERLRAEAETPFDLVHGPLLRARLLRLGAEHHVLALTVHHIVADGWSLGVLTAELSALYPAMRDGREDPLPALNLQYGDYAVWQRRWLAGEQLQRQADYWRGALEGAPALLKLPGDRPRPERQDFAGASLPVQLDARLVAGLRMLAQRHGVTLYMTVLGAWAALLARLSGQDEVVIGCPVAGRIRAELEPLLGLFVNTLAIRIDTADVGAESLLQQVKGQLLEAQAHQDLPFEQVVEIVRPARSLSHTPLFQTTLNWQATSGAALALEGLQLEAVAHSAQVAKFDLALTLGEYADTLVGALEYATALFNEDTMRRYLGYFDTLLPAMVGNDQTPLAHIDLVGADERQRLVHTFNATDQGPAQRQTVHGLIEARAAQAPQACAAQAGARSLSYGELNAQANALAHHLIGLGVRADDRVVVVARRGLETLVGLLAVLKAGGAYVPVDPAQPDERLHYLLGDSAPTVVLTQAALRERLGVVDAPLLLLDQPSWPARHDNPRVPGLTADNLAYVIYTSGSSGLPKGVMVEHHCLVNLVQWHCAAFDLAPGDHSASLAGFGFDAMAWEVWPALCAGAQLHLPPEHLGNEQLDELLEWWCAQPLKVAFLPTPVAEYLFSRDLRHPTLRTLLIGGDRLRQFNRDPGYRVINNYGPTEATVVATSGQVMPGGALDIGKPIGKARVYLLDEQRQLVPFGCVGELYVGGAGVARGYLGRADLSAERFLEDPFSEVPGARMYRSGDLARWQADGTLEYLGRNDDQVKIRGIRIELGEIEGQLAQLEGVEEVLLLAREDQPGQPRLVAYYQGHGAALSAATLRQGLQQRLPAYMVPAAFVHLDAWPLTANGKVDRRALPAPTREALASSAYEAPAGELECTLAEVWRELLQVEQVGRQDRFFDLGGHSLLAMRLLARVRQRLGLELSLGELFADDSLAGVAASLGSSTRTLLPPIEIAPRGDALPLSFAQQRLWFLAQFEQASAAYHIPLVLQLQGDLQRPALAQALRRLVERHESLRSHFVEVDGQPCVRLADADAFELVWEQHSDGDEPSLATLIQNHAQQPFALDQALPLRACVVQLAPQRHLLLLTLHHIAADGWSMGVLFRELSALYQAFACGQADPLPALAVQYIDYAVWQRRWLSGEAWQRQADYWLKALAGAPELISLPCDRPRPQRQDYRGASVELSLDPHLCDALKGVCSRHGVTPYMVFMAAWAVLLARLSGQHEVVIGSAVANRRLAELDGLIGMFVNSIALRIDTDGAPDVATLLARVKAVVLAGQEHQDLPFEQVVELLRPGRSLAHTPLYQVSMDWQGGSEQQTLRLGELSVSAVGGQSSIAKFDLGLSVGEQGDGFAGALIYATALFERATIERYVGYLEQLLWTFASSDAAIPAHVGLINGLERQRLLLDFNATAVGYDLTQTLHGLIEAQAERKPDAVAVCGEEGELSYRQLDEQANRLAHHLIGLGVKPDDRVAICVERGLSMVVGLLAILKAGGAYVPLDPSYPPERIAHMLADSAPLAVLAHAATREVLQAWPGQLIDLDQPVWEQQPGSTPQVPALSAQNLAYVIYTSGSTGLPKGVMVEHRNVVNLVRWSARLFPVLPAATVLHKTPSSFDASVWELFWPLCSGVRLVLARAQDSHDPQYLAQLIEARQVSVVQFVPALLQQFLESPQSACCTGLSDIVCGGGELTAALVAQVRQRLPGVRLHNVYGPTETTVDCSVWTLAPGEPLPPGPPPIGKPIDNTCLYVLDDQLQPVPQGVAGELYVGGVQVTRGYLNRDELTAERFIDDPFGTRPGARLYRTGDLARHVADGNLEYLGRNDDQVKIRGLRIELGEIQAGLSRVAGIKDAVVIAREQQLIAYYTGEQQVVETLRAALLAHLPQFMVPALFMHLDAMPLSPNGKLDRKALPQIEVESRVFETPEGETETLLASLWAELLGVERVGRQDNFFELGGHSLLAVSLVAKLRAAGLQADIQVLFTTPTLAALAATLGQYQRLQVPANRIEADCQHITPDLLPLVALPQEAIDRIVASVPGGVANVQDIYPLGPLQAGILFHHLASEGEDTYLLRARFAVADRQRLSALQQALDQVIERHDSLRTSLYWEGLVQPLQVVWRKAPLQVEAASAAQLQRLDLTQAPLLRLVYEEQADSGKLIATLLFHHAVMDHIALDVLRAELQAILLGAQQQLPSPVPYRNYIAHVLQGDGEQGHEAFFREQLGDIDEPTVPYAQYPAPHPQAQAELSRWVDADLARQVREQARQLGVSAASLMHLAWAMVLGQLSGRDSVVFGTVLLGRMHGGEGVERAFGVFINTLPLRIDLGALPVREALLDAHRRLVGLLKHEHAQLALAQRCSALPAGAPLFSALLNYRHSATAQAVDNQTQQAWQGIELLHAEERSNYPLALSIDDLGEGFVLTAQCAPGVDARRICAYQEHALQSLVDALRQAPEQGLELLSVLPDDEHEQTVRAFNAGHRQDYPQAPVQRLFEQRVARHPSALAVVEGEQRLSYGELNEQANRLAHHLLGKGVQPGDHVAILLPRSITLLVAQLAIVKCAAVYVPLDVHAPAERQLFMIQDCQAVLVLTLRHFALEQGVRRIDLDAVAVDTQPRYNPNLTQGVDAVAYVMYTSGSTGTPKGVRVAHRGIARLVLNDGYADFNPQDRFAFAANPAFDASTMEVWGALLNGGQVRVIDHPTLIDPLRFATALCEQGVTVLFLTTALFNQYVQLLPDALAGLRVLLCGGERSDPAAFRTLLAHAPDLRLLHCYGPTETTTFATTSRVRAVAEAASSVPIGKPIGSTQVYVLDAHLRPVPLGVVGELYIGGDGVAQGYLHRPQLTAEHFIDDPFNERPGAKLYRSGDLACWREDGQLECLGRNDDQVKIRGFRIELGEIEQHLGHCPGISEAVVMALRLDSGPLRLVAWFTRQDPALQAATVRGFLSERLPPYMVPSAYVGLEALPLNNNGKIDRKALPLPLEQDLAVTAYEAPATELEQRLADCWAQVLDVARVGRHDSFFELGGHSLLAIRLVAEMAKVDAQATLVELFQHPSVAQLAACLETREAPPEETGLVTVRAAGSQAPLFLVHEFSGFDLYFPALGRHIDGDFPIYGLPGIAAGQAQLRTMECLAARLLLQIRTVQPHGPYRLAGWSFGGVLAYEIAAQLLGADEQVAFIGLIDTYVPRLTDRGKARWQGAHLLERHLLAYCHDYWQAQGETGSEQLAKVERLRPQVQDFEMLLAYCRAEQLIPNLAQSSDQQLRHYFERELAHGHALAHYRVAPLALPVQLFCAQQVNPLLRHAGPTLGWAEVLPAEQLRCVAVPGDHQSMLQAPQVQVLGQALSQALQQVTVQGAAPVPVPVAIQSGHGAHAPLFCVPGAGDSITSFIGLAEALGADWPVYGLQSRGLDGSAVPHSSVEAAAECHVQAIEALYPHGPLNLLGHSFGGWVAHAMAARFQAMGRPVHSLTLVDSEAPGEGSTCGRPYTLTEALERLIEALQLSSGKALGIEPLAFAEASDDDQLRQLHGAMVRSGLLAPRSSPRVLDGTVRTFATALRTAYRPLLRYSGPVGLVLVDDPSLDEAGNAREHAAMQVGWHTLLPQLALWQGPGNHFSILKVPDVFSLAAWWHDGQALATKATLS